jgi:membrane fusion protein (multidrug efflux system)
MRRSRTGLSTTLVLLAAAVLAGCAKEKPKAAAPPPKVVVTRAVQKDVPVTQEWIGTTQGDVNADIRPKVDGYLLRRTYEEGSLVKAGELLFEIDPRQFQAQLRQAEANLAQANATLSKAERDVARYEPLVAQKAISQQELDNARSARQAGQAAVASAQAAVESARLNLSWTRVLSPIEGIAGIASQQVGDLVSPQTVLTTVSKVNPIRVLYQMSEQEYLQLQKDEAMRSAPLELVLGDGTVFPQKGRFAFSGREVDVKTGTIAAIGLFPNPGNLIRPGQYAKVRSVVKVRKGAIVVPQRAVNEMQGAFQVGVVGADDTAEIRAVKVAERTGSSWVIEAGLKPGERVIVEGFSRVKAGSPVTPEEETTAAAAAPTPTASGSGGK